MHILIRTSVSICLQTTFIKLNLTITNSMQNKQKRNSINSITQKSHKIPANSSDRVAELELELRQAKTYIDSLKKLNSDLIEQISEYKSKIQEFQIMKQQLDFRRQEEQKMQEHMQNYQQINQKLRQKVCVLENKLKQYEGTQYNSVQFKENRKSVDISIDGSYNSSSRKQSRQARKSLGDQQCQSRQNHPLTPKNRVSIDFTSFLKNQIPGKRKVFL